MKCSCHYTKIHFLHKKLHSKLNIILNQTRELQPTFSRYFIHHNHIWKLHCNNSPLPCLLSKFLQSTTNHVEHLSPLTLMKTIYISTIFSSKKISFLRIWWKYLFFRWSHTKRFEVLFIYFLKQDIASVFLYSNLQGNCSFVLKFLSFLINQGYDLLTGKFLRK